MKKKIFSILFALVLVVSFSLVTAVPAMAVTWTVDDDGPADFSTIQAAVNAAGTGDTINVAAGTYAENVGIPPGKDNLQLLGEGMVNTILSPASGTAITVGSPVTIKGFHILQSDSSSAILIAWGSSGVSGTSENPAVIEANKIESPSLSRGNGINFKDYVSDYWVIKDNELINRKLAIYLNRASHLVITGNTLSGYKEGIGTNWSGEPAHDLTITGNNFLGTDYPFTPQDLLEKAAIVLGEVSYNVEIRGNTITGSPNGIRIPDHLTAVTNLANVHINFNNIVGNGPDTGVKNESETDVDATCNWWGHASGPFHPTLNPGGTGDAVSDHVDFMPWLIAPAPGGPCLGGLPPTEMSEFEIDKASIDFGNPGDDEVRLKGTFELDLVNGNGVDITEDVIVTVGPLSETITMVEKHGKWEYKRPDGDGSIKKMTIKWKDEKFGKFDITMDKADLSELTDPEVTISIQIGDDLGEGTIPMRVHWDYKAPHD